MPRLHTILLAALFGPAALPATAQDLPPGDGRERVAALCTTCHPASLIRRAAGYTEAGWRDLTGTMIDLERDPERRSAIHAYLARHFPPNDRRAPKPAPGPVGIAFREWVAPTPGQRARDPVEAADGTIWWVGQMGNPLGRLDPATGTFQSWPIPSGGIFAGIVRHMRATRNGDLLIHQGATNRIILVSVAD